MWPFLSGFVSLNNIILKCIHFIVSVVCFFFLFLFHSSSFLFIAECYPVVWTLHNSFIHSPVGGHRVVSIRDYYK